MMKQQLGGLLPQVRLGMGRPCIDRVACGHCSCAHVAMPPLRRTPAPAAPHTMHCHAMPSTPALERAPCAAGAGRARQLLLLRLHFGQDPLCPVPQVPHHAAGGWVGARVLLVLRAAVRSAAGCSLRQRAWLPCMQSRRLPLPGTPCCSARRWLSSRAPCPPPPPPSVSSTRSAASTCPRCTPPTSPPSPTTSCCCSACAAS